MFADKFCCPSVLVVFFNWKIPFLRFNFCESKRWVHITKIKAFQFTGNVNGKLCVHHLKCFRSSYADGWSTNGLGLRERDVS